MRTDGNRTPWAFGSVLVVAIISLAVISASFVWCVSHGVPLAAALVAAAAVAGNYAFLRRIVRWASVPVDERRPFSARRLRSPAAAAVLDGYRRVRLDVRVLSSGNYRGETFDATVTFASRHQAEEYVRRMARGVLTRNFRVESGGLSLQAEEFPQGVVTETVRVLVR